MNKIIDRFKNPGLCALFLSFVALTAVEFSYILGGINWLDTLLFLLVPACILLIIQLVLNCTAGPKNYCVALTILAACMIFSFFRLSSIEIGTLGDYYHILKVVASSIKNSFFTQLQYDTFPDEGYISDFVESLWGIFWRWTNWDFVIVLLQALPIILLWHQLVKFFQNQKIETFPALLATVVVMTLEIPWCQQGSPYIDSTVGMLIGINLLLCYSYLTPPYERRFSNLAGLVFISGLCIISKPTGLCVGTLGLTIAIVLGFKHLNTIREKILLPLIALPALAYFLYHQIQVLIQKGSFFFPYVNKNNDLQFFKGYEVYYTPLMFHSWIRDHAFNFKPLYVLSSWLSDYTLDPQITPDPYIRGNGLVFTYLVIPILLFWIFQHKNILKNKLWKDPRLSIFVVIFIYYYSFDGSIDVRFALGYNILILSWCLSYLWQNLEQWSRLKWLKPLPVITLCLLVLMSIGSYCDGIRGKRFEGHILSPFAIQKEIFPHSYSADIRTFFIQKLFQEHGAVYNPQVTM